MALIVGLTTCAADEPRFPAASLEAQLLQESPHGLAQAARAGGDAQRGAVVFHQSYMACARCHTLGDDPASRSTRVGPDLANLGPDVGDEQLVESVLSPSKEIRKGFESQTVLTTDGRSLTGIVVERTADKLVLQKGEPGGERVTIQLADIESSKSSGVSIMPTGQVNQLASRQQFLDLVRYLIEIRDGGLARARQLQPPPQLLTLTVPEYEQHVDHAGLMAQWDGESQRRGEAIYDRVCANCHGTLERQGSLPTSLRFAEGKFKNGSDPLAMYRTITYGFGFMAPQTWMVPRQKYDVIHFIREQYLRSHNPSQYAVVDRAYLAGLPKGDTFGPDPSTIQPWVVMDYGPSLIHTYEVPQAPIRPTRDPRSVEKRLPNIAYKGIAVRLDPGAGGVSRGSHWIVYEHDTLRVAAAWSASEQDHDAAFIDWHSVQFDGMHAVHPRLVGDVSFANPVGPGWANPDTGSFVDDERVLGRDGRRYGPLPRSWARYRGLYQFQNQVVLSYSIGDTNVLDSPGLKQIQLPGLAAQPLFLRTLNIGPRNRDLILQVATHPDASAKVTRLVAGKDGAAVVLGPLPSVSTASGTPGPEFDGATYAEIKPSDALGFTDQDFTIAARIRTTEGGTIVACTAPGPQWVPNGQAFFVRGGRLCFDIGWVGVVTSRARVDDGQWHQVAASWQRDGHQLQLIIDGRVDAHGTLAAKSKLDDSVVRLGFTAPDFPQPQSFFRGDLSEVRFYRRQVPAADLRTWEAADGSDESLAARWIPATAAANIIVDATGHAHDAVIRHSSSPGGPSPRASVAVGLEPSDMPAKWEATDDGRLRLKIPAGQDPLRFTIWLTSVDPPHIADSASLGSVTPSASAADVVRPASAAAGGIDRDLDRLTHGGPPRWPEKIQTRMVMGSDSGPLAADTLVAPDGNPWLAQLRFTGLDFLPEGRLAACTWDGDVWLVSGLDRDTAPASGASSDTPAVDPHPLTLSWQRIASGLFQPLGLKVVDGQIYVTCRDQLVVLHDLNGDGETDFYECFNDDHQVTEHFHEFAMGLQVDAEGNFYYAKSARHALPAVVPQHGTLLRIRHDGSHTDILATGFRAANGVCLNPDGTFFVTDQEGHWTPKNRINWVHGDGPSEFFGNMWGYHDITDPSDAAMKQPLCWITNSFDRSPAELLWVTSDRWGPLRGSLLNLSYGYGKIFVVPHENIGGQMQGGMCELPLSPFPTGIMRGRFRPEDGQLYVCGMFAWAGNAVYPGGLYRVRYTGRPIYVPVELHARRGGLRITFTAPLDPASVADTANYALKTWTLKRSANYGSDHYNEKPLAVRSATLEADGRTVALDLPDLEPTWCMEIKYTLRSASGERVPGMIHNTIHRLPE